MTLRACLVYSTILLRDLRSDQSVSQCVRMYRSLGLSDSRDPAHGVNVALRADAASIPASSILGHGEMARQKVPHRPSAHGP